MRRESPFASPSVAWREGRRSFFPFSRSSSEAQKNDDAIRRDAERKKGKGEDEMTAAGRNYFGDPCTPLLLRSSNQFFIHTLVRRWFGVDGGRNKMDRDLLSFICWKRRFKDGDTAWQIWGLATVAINAYASKNIYIEIDNKRTFTWA